MDERIPAYLQERLLSCYGQETAERIELGYKAVRPVTMRSVQTGEKSAVNWIGQALHGRMSTGMNRH